MAYYDDNGDEYKSIKEPLFPISRIGTTALIDQSNADPIQAIRAEIFAGAGNIEICAPGTGAANRGNMTFDGIESDQRQAIREMAKINDVNITTHATFRLGNLAGLGERGYSEGQRRMTMDEIKKAIDFSAEAANGGSVVVHTGEYPRALYGNKTINKDGYEFKMHGKEDKEATYYLVNEHTGQVIDGVRGDAVIFEPVIEKDKNGNDIFIVGSDGKPVVDDVIQEDILSNEKITSKYGKDWNKLPDSIKQEAYVRKFSHEKGNIKTQKVTFEEFKDRKLKELKKKGFSEDSDQAKEIIREFYKTQVYSQVRQALGQAREYEQHYTEGLDTRDDILKQVEQLKKIKASLSEDGWDEFVQTYTPKFASRRAAMGYEQGQDPIKFYEQQLNENQRSILHGREAATGGRTQAKELLRKINEATPIEDFALKNSSKTVAELGVYAYDQTKRMMAERPKDKVKPIAITMENMFPEMGYGAHADEIITLVKNGREQMAKDLAEQRQLSSKEAKKAAEDHIKITFDTGHFNIWRKYFQPQKGETKDDTDKRFKEWQKKEMQKLVDAGVIGNVHIADNLGFDDDHLTPGRGTAPIKELLEMLKKKGYSDVVTSEGGFARGKSGQEGIKGLWKLAGSSIYNRGSAGTDAWVNPTSRFYSTHNSYLGSANKPNFIFKGYAPDSEDWTPWSGTRME